MQSFITVWAGGSKPCLFISPRQETSLTTVINCVLRSRLRAASNLGLPTRESNILGFPKWHTNCWDSLSGILIVELPSLNCILTVPCWAARSGRSVGRRGRGRACGRRGRSPGRRTPGVQFNRYFFCPRICTRTCPKL